jgi:adenylate kinase
LCDVDGSKLLTRSDDREDVISERLAAYESQTKPVADYYRAQRRLVVVNADRTMDEIAAQIFGVIDRHGHDAGGGAAKLESAS